MQGSTNELDPKRSDGRRAYSSVRFERLSLVPVRGVFVVVVIVCFTHATFLFFVIVIVIVVLFHVALKAIGAVGVSGTSIAFFPWRATGNEGEEQRKGKRE